MKWIIITPVDIDSDFLAHCNPRTKLIKVVAVYYLDYTNGYVSAEYKLDFVDQSFSTGRNPRDVNPDGYVAFLTSIFAHPGHTQACSITAPSYIAFQHSFHAWQDSGTRKVLRLVCDYTNLDQHAIFTTAQTLISTHITTRMKKRDKSRYLRNNQQKMSIINT